MIKRALFALLGLAAFALPLSAQDIESSSISANLALGQPVADFPALGLVNAGPFAYPSGFGWNGPAADFLPPFAAVPQRRVSRPMPSTDYDPYFAQEFTRPDKLRFSGEIGFLYGNYSGKYGGDLTSGYILGTVGNDKFQLTVGYSRSEFSGRGAR